jgi:hypothetical protein
MGLLALLCDIFFVLPDTLSTIALIALTVSVIPAAAVAGIVYGRDNLRAFSVEHYRPWPGCLLTTCTLLEVFSPQPTKKRPR